MKLRKEVIIIGQAVPNIFKNGTIGKCLVGITIDTHELIRLYPLYISYNSIKIHRWDIISVNLEQRVNDNRKESYHIIGDWKEQKRQIKIEDKIGNDIKDYELRRSLIEIIYNYTKEKCFLLLWREHNESLFIIKPKIKKSYISNVKCIDKDINSFMGHQNYNKRLMINYECSDNCVTVHKQQVLDHGCFEFWRRNKNSPAEEVLNGYKLDNINYDIYFVIGNHYSHRKSFMIITPLPLKRRKIK